MLGVKVCTDLGVYTLQVPRTASRHAPTLMRLKPLDIVIYAWATLRDPHLARALTGCAVGRMLLLPSGMAEKLALPIRQSFVVEGWKS